MQLPEDWQINISDLENRSADGRDAIASPMKALIEAGYIYRERQHDAAGRFTGYDYYVFERPEHLERWATVNGKTVNGKTVNGKTVNGKTVNGKTVISKYENTNYEEKSKNEGSECAPARDFENLLPVEAEKEKEIPPGRAVTPDAGPKIRLDQHPQYQTPTELRGIIEALYAAHPNEWKYGVLENSRGKQYTEDRRKEIIWEFCAHAVVNYPRKSYGDLNSLLQKWFFNQRQFERPAPAQQPSQRGKQQITRGGSDEAAYLEKQAF
jgi:hypothetical protein